MGRGIEVFLLVLLGVVLFGAKRLPGAAKALGESINIFKKTVREDPTPPPHQSRQIPGSVEPDPGREPGRNPGA